MGGPIKAASAANVISEYLNNEAPDGYMATFRTIQNHKSKKDEVLSLRSKLLLVRGCRVPGEAVIGNGYTLALGGWKANRTGYRGRTSTSAIAVDALDEVSVYTRLLGVK